MLHNLHELDDLVHVLPSRDQALKHQDLKVGEHVPVFTAHHVHVFLRQFEGGVFKADVFARRVRQDEAVVDVNEMTLTARQTKRDT